MAKILFVTEASELGFFDTVTKESDFAAYTNRAYTDVAVSPDGEIYASSFNALYKLALIGGNVGEEFAGYLGNTSINALDFTNEGLLIAAGGNELFSFDLVSGERTRITTMPSSSSGDVETIGNSAFVSLSNGALYEFDIDTGSILSAPISTPSLTYGLSYSDGVLYGFSRDDVVSFDLEQGSFEFVDRDSDAIQGAYYGSSSEGIIRFDTNTNGADRIVGGDQAEFFEGGRSNDTIIAGNGNDTVYGDAGNDIIWAGPGDTGNDLLDGGPGRDTLGGGGGNDSIYGEGGADVIFAGGGSDEVLGGSQNDVMWLGTGGDIALGDRGNDILGGGYGNDSLFGDAGDDVLYGSAGADILYSGSGTDLLFGGDGQDSLVSEDGDDVMYGGSGDDVFYFTGQFGNDSIGGFDRLDDDTIFFYENFVSSMSDLTISQEGDDTIIRTADGSITLWNVDASTLDAADFLF